MRDGTAMVLGASGFIGRHVVTALRRHRSEAAVVGVDRAADPISGCERWVTLDLAAASADVVADLVAEHRPDRIVNCTGTLTGDRAYLTACNVLTVAKLLDALERTEGSPRLVHLGSAAEYGAVEPGSPVAEITTPRPVGPYGVTKLAATQLVQSAAVTRGVDAVVLRVFNPVGSGMATTTLPGRTAASIREALRQDEAVLHLGPLDAYRDFVDVRDVASAVAEATTRADLCGEVLNVASGRAVQARELVRTLADVAGFAGEIVEARPGSARSGDVPWQCADLSHVLATLEWSPKFGLRESLEDLWESLE